MAEDYEHPPNREANSSGRRFRKEAATSGKAIASLICGIAALFIPIVPAILAITFGALGLRDIGRSRGRLGGQGLAIAGLVTGTIGLILIGPVMIALLLPAVQRVREAANQIQSANNMKQIGLALHNYHDTYGTFPPAVVYSADGKPLYSWRVLILPFLGERRLFSQFKLDEPWDSPNNRPLLAQMPKVYGHPAQGRPTEPYGTHYQVLTGGGAMFDVGPNNRPKRFADITDGTATTIMVVEAAKPVPWTQPEDLPYAPDLPLPSLGLNPRTFNVLMVDGSVHRLPKDTDEKTLRALITFNGNEIVEVPGAAASPEPAKQFAPKRTKEVFK